MSIETKNPNQQQETKKPGWFRRNARRIGAGALVSLAGAGVGAAINEASHDHSQSLTSHEKTVHFSPKAAEKGSKFEGLDGKQLVIAEQAEARKDLDAAGKAEALSVLEKMRDPAMGIEENQHGTGVQNKSSQLEGRISESTNDAFANFYGDKLYVEDFDKDDGTSSTVFEIPPEVVDQLKTKQQQGGVDIDDLEQAVQNPDTHATHLGIVEGKWDAAKNRGRSVKIARNGTITLSTSDEGFKDEGDLASGPKDKLASPTDVDSFISLAKKVNKEKAS